MEQRAERYKQEMLELYSRRSDEKKDDEKSEAVTLAPEKTANYEQSVGEKYPEPDISDIYTVDNSEADIQPLEKSVKKYTSYIDDGYIIAYVRTGYESSPVVGAAVRITAAVDGNRIIFASGVTDRNGASPRFRLPVPDISHSQSPEPSIRPYSLFDVSVEADGFFNARSVDVPVFSGITSVQNFNMIPVPLMAAPSSETITYYNQEPDLTGGKE